MESSDFSTTSSTLIGLDDGHTQHREIPFAPGRFAACEGGHPALRLSFGLGLSVISHIFQVRLIGVRSIRAKAFGNACGLLDRHSMQAVGKIGFEDGFLVLVRACLGLAKQGGVLLAQRQGDRHKLIERLKLARIGLNETDRGHRSSDGLLRLLFALALFFLIKRGVLGLLAHGRVHSAAKPLALVPSCVWLVCDHKDERKTRE